MGDLRVVVKDDKMSTSSAVPLSGADVELVVQLEGDRDPTTMSKLMRLLQDDILNRKERFRKHK